MYWFGSFGLFLLGTLNLDDYFLSRVREVFRYCQISSLSLSFSFSSPSKTSLMQMLVFLMLSQKCLKLSPVLKKFFSLFRLSFFHYSVFQFCSSVLSNLQFIPSSVFFFFLISTIQLFISDRVSFIISSSFLK